MSDTSEPQVDPRVLARYEAYDEDGRLWRAGLGDLVRLRTWEILDRFVPASGRVLDVGGGPGAHAAHLASRGDRVTLVDPVPRHVTRARARAREPGGAPFAVCLGEATSLRVAPGGADAVLLMGPLYHLVERAERLAALAEARRALRPGGRLVAEVIGRYTWAMEATVKGLTGSPAVPRDVGRVATGLSQDPAAAAPGSFWAYFHRLDELEDELAEAGFGDVALIAVEGFAWLLGDLERRMLDPEAVLAAVRLTEREPSMLGCSAHVMGIASAHVRDIGTVDPPRG
jgi:SAM-dependent methyltransferase